jgi:hypothetical protein
MSKKEPKTCIKCDERYLGEQCPGCHYNQYAHYEIDIPPMIKVLIGGAFVIIIGLILTNK